MPVEVFKGTGGGLGGTVGALAGSGLVGMTDVPHHVKTIVEYAVYVRHSDLPPEVLMALQGLAVFFANAVTFLVGVAMSAGLAWIGAHFGQATQNGGQGPGGLAEEVVGPNGDKAKVLE